MLKKQLLILAVLSLGLVGCVDDKKEDNKGAHPRDGQENVGNPQSSNANIPLPFGQDANPNLNPNQRQLNPNQQQR